jgi:hypothetical protein
MSDEDFYVLSFLIDGSDPSWDLRGTIFGTRAQIARTFDLNRLPYGSQLLRGEAARRYVEKGIRDELRYQRERQGRRNN